MKDRLFKLNLSTFFAIFALLLLATTAVAAVPPQPSYNTATVDGDYSEWNLDFDFFANMYRAGDPQKEVESKLYVRYDCFSSTLYVLVLQELGVPILVEPNNAFVKLGNTTKLVDGSSGNDGTPPDFAWIGQNYDGNPGHAQGWEASAILSTGNYSDFNVHTNVYDDGNSQTSAVKDREIPLNIRCLDFGDLPASYNNTTIGDNGARHVIGDLFLGATIDADPDGAESNDATGDDQYPQTDDEDGVAFNYSWQNGEDGACIDVTVHGSGGWLAGWIDWGNGGLVQVIDQSVSDGTQKICFDVPANTFPAPADLEIFMRFRLYDGTPVAAAMASGPDAIQASPTGQVTNGEVEDYFQKFDPNAVTLEALSARTAGIDLTDAGLVVLMLLGGAFAGFFLYKQRRLRV